MKTKVLAIPLAILLGAGLSCDMNPTRPATEGSISIVLMSPSGTLFRANARAEGTSDVVPIEDAVASIALTSARVIVAGPTNKTVTQDTPTGGNFVLEVTGLAPGTYTVTVEGLANGQVAHFGFTSGVNVVAGQQTPATVTFPVFQPQVPNATVEDTSDVLRFTVSWNAVTNATSYLVEWSQSSTMANAQSKTVTGATTTEVTVTQEGKYYFTVKAMNPLVSTGGLPSATKSVFVFQGVATVTVTPASPSIAAGSTQQMAAEARDADNGVVNNVTWFWASSNHTVATVTQAGVVAAISPGTATITAVGKGMPGSTTITVTAAPLGPATKLAFLASPGAATAGQAMSQVRVAVQTTGGQTVTTDNATQVALAFGTNAGGGTLSGTTTATVVNGVATFDGLSIEKSGLGYTLLASSNALTSSTSAAFNVSHAAAHHLSFSIQPTSAIAGEALSPAVQVEVRDQFENVVNTGTISREAITIAIGTNPGAGTLSGTKVVNAISGIASFNGISLDKVGDDYTLSASAAGGLLTGATSGTFDIAPAAAARLAFFTQPAAIIEGNSTFTTTVRVTDAFGNVVPTATNPITLEIGRRAPFGGSARLLGTPTIPAVAGVAVFNNLRVDVPGSGYTLNARSGSLQTAGSDEFRIRLTFTKIDVGSAHTCAVTVNNSAYCWGNNGSGQLGLGTFASDSVPRLVTGGLAWANVSAGNNHTCGITTADAVYCWGTNGSGQIATGSFGNSFPEPQAITAPAGVTFKSVSSGGDHVCATSVVTATSATANAYCWGNGGNGQLGDGSAISIAAVTPVGGGLAFKSINAGDFVTCGIATTDLAYCWGYNGEGGVAVNDFVALKATPQQVNASTAFAQVAAGRHSCFRKTHAPVDIFCSGQGVSGQLGNGGNVNIADEAPITSQLTWTDVAVGPNTTCMLDDAGLAYCTGLGTSGQIGNSAIVNQNVRQPVTGGRSFTNVSVGSVHVCAVTATGEAWCWGNQANGRLGNGGFANFIRSDPVAVVR